MILGFKHKGKASIALLVISMFLFGLVGMVQPSTAMAKTLESDPATELTVVLNEDGEITTLATYTIEELEKMPLVKRQYSSIDSLPAPVFTAAEGLDLVEFLESLNIDINSIKGFRFYATDFPPTFGKHIKKDYLLDPDRCYFPKIRECWEHWDRDSMTFKSGCGVEEGATPVQPMLAIKSYQARAIESDTGATMSKPRFDLMDKSTTIRLCLGQKSPDECSTMNFVKWVYKVEVEGRLNQGEAPKTDGEVAVKPKDGSAAELDEKSGVKPEEESVGETDEKPDVKGEEKLTKDPTEKPAAEPITEPEVRPTVLKDISGHWARENIEQLVSLGAINGYPDGTFRPNHTITRAEFTAVLVKAFQLEPRSGKVFADTVGHWAQEAIATASAHGIVGGYDENTFGPNDPITREQMAAMMVKTAGLAATGGEVQFSDSGIISDWAQQAVAIAINNGIIKGYPGNTFKPRGHATRAEAVTMVVRAR